MNSHLYDYDPWDDYDDGPSECQLCGGNIIYDWMGDPSVPNGTMGWYECKDCGHHGDEPEIKDYYIYADQPETIPPEVLADWLDENGHPNQAESLRELIEHTVKESSTCNPN